MFHTLVQNYSHVLNRPGQVQYHSSTEHCHLSQPAQKRDPFGFDSFQLYDQFCMDLHSGTSTS